MTLSDHIRRFADDTRASVAIVAAFTLVAMIMATGMAVDYGLMIKQRGELQAAADAAAIAGAREIPLALSNPQQIEVVAGNHARINLGIASSGPGKSENRGEDDGQPVAKMMSMSAPSMMAASDSVSGGGGDSGSSGSGSSDSPIRIKTNIYEDDNTVEVTIEQDWKPFFAAFLPDSLTAFSVTSRAQIMGTGKICVLGLMKKQVVGRHSLGQQRRIKRRRLWGLQQLNQLCLNSCRCQFASVGRVYLRGRRLLGADRQQLYPVTNN